MTSGKFRRFFPLFTAFCLGVAAVGGAKEKPPEEWDGLTKTKVKGIDLAYVRQGVDMSVYSKVMMDPLEVAFDKNWKPEAPGSNRKLSQQDIDTVRERLTKLATDTFVETLSKDGGYPIVTEPGPDVMRLTAGLLDVYVEAPDTGEPGIVRTYTASAGRMTLVAELRDSETGALFARVIDGRGARDNQYLTLTNRAENAHQDAMIVREWATILRKRLDAVRAYSHAAAN